MLCIQCQREVDINASSCPHCGAVIGTKNTFEDIHGVKEALKLLIDTYGKDLINDTKKFVSFLNDYMPEYDKERRLLKTVLSNDVVRGMLKEDDSGISAMKAKEYMINELFLSDTATEFVLECIAYIMNWDYKPIRVVVENVYVDSDSAINEKKSSSQNTDLKDFKPFDALKYKLKRTVEIPRGYSNIKGFTFDGFNFMRILKISEGIVCIGEYAFSECKKLKNVFLPSTLRIIKKGAFSSCTRLHGIKIPDGVTAIEESTFSFCQNLESVDIPLSVSSIGDEAFIGCERLRNILIPDGVKFIGKNVFLYCPNIVIKCYENSYVHKFCQTENIPFEFIQNFFADNY